MKFRNCGKFVESKFKIVPCVVLWDSVTCSGEYEKGNEKGKYILHCFVIIVSAPHSPVTINVTIKAATKLFRQ